MLKDKTKHLIIPALETENESINSSLCFFKICSLENNILKPHLFQSETKNKRKLIHFRSGSGFTNHHIKELTAEIVGLVKT